MARLKAIHRACSYSSDIYECFVLWKCEQYHMFAYLLESISGNVFGARRVDDVR